MEVRDGSTLLSVLLVKHAMPVVDPATPPSTWPLSVAGRRRVIALAASLRGRSPTRVVASPERKARETGEILAGLLRVPLAECADLREHERPGLAFAREPGQFEARMRDAFARPEERLFGGESVAEAVDRLAAGLSSLGAAHPGDRIAFVSHGTVIAGFVARTAGVDPFPLWRSLSLPSWIALDLAQGRVVDGWRAAWSDGDAQPGAP